MLLIQLKNTLCPSTYVEIYKKDTRCIDPEKGMYYNKLLYEGEARSIPCHLESDRIERIGAMRNRYGSSEVCINLE